MIAEFLAQLSNVSELTRAAYGYALDCFEDAKIPLDNDVLVSFNALLAKERYAPTTAALYLSALRRYLEWLDARDQLPAGMTRAKAEARLKSSRSKRSVKIAPKRVDKRLPLLLQFYGAAPPKETPTARLERLRNFALLHTLYATAGRVSEVCALTRAQVGDGESDRTTVIGKGNKARTLFLSSEARAAIRSYCAAREDAYPALFISHRRGKGGALSRNRAWQIVKEAVRGCGLSKITSPHDFRRFMATSLSSEGMDVLYIQKVLGHESPETTQRYAQVDDDRVQQQLDEYRISPGEAIKHATETANPQ